MRTAALAFALAALAVAPATLAAPLASLEVRFQPPAQAGPAATASGASWALLVFDGSGDPETAFNASFPQGAQAANLTVQRVSHAGARDNVRQPIETDAPPYHLGPFLATARPRGPASLYVEANAIELRVEGARAGLLLSEPCLAPLLPYPETWKAEARYDRLCPGLGDVAVVARGVEDGVAVRLVATGVRTVEWHNLGVACAGVGPCPDGGSRAASSFPSPAGTVQVETFEYRRLESGDGRVEGAGDAVRAVVGGPRLDLAVEGTVRLPRAHAEGCPCGALDGGTLQADGLVALRGLRQEGNGSLGATLEGDLTGARVDESAVPMGLVLGAGATGLAIGALLLGLKAVAALFSRVARERTLEAPGRRGLLAAVQGAPGIHERGAARLTGLAPSTVRHHAKVLAARGFLRKVRDGKVVRLFPAGGGSLEDGLAAAALQEPALRLLHGWLQSNPGASAAAAVRHAVSAWGWSRSTAYHRLARVQAIARAGRGGDAAAMGDSVGKDWPAAKAPSA